MSPSPWRVLLLRIAPWFAVTNLAIFPLFATFVNVLFTGFLGGTPAPPSQRMWLPVLMTFVIGCVALVPAQALLATICLTWTTGRLWRRLANYWFIALGWLVCFFAGIPVFFVGSALHHWVFVDSTAYSTNFDPESFWRDTVQLLAYSTQLPMILLGVQLPFWCLRYFAGARLKSERPSSANEMARDPLSIMDLMLATAIVAVSLGLLQIGDRTIAAAEGDASNAFLFVVLIVAAVCFGISLFIGLPLAMLFLSRASLALAWGITIAGAGLGAVGVLGIMVQLRFTGSLAEQLGINCLVAYASSLGYAAGLTLLRRAGWRLTYRNVG